jgi:hypothetical protein
MRSRLNLSPLKSAISAAINKSLSETSVVLKKAIKDELRSPKKSGELKPRSRYKAFSERRSAAGESLARDSGASEKLISSSKFANTARVGFKVNPYGFDYVGFHEAENNRPTVAKALKKSKYKIHSIFRNNIKSRLK